MSLKSTITNGFEKIGAAWAVTDKKTILPSDDFDAKKTYHVHPNADNPRQDSIVTFDNLAQVKGYVEARKEAEAIYQATGDAAKAYEVMEDFYCNL